MSRTKTKVFETVRAPVPREPLHNQIEAAYPLIANAAGLTEARSKRLVAEVYRAMIEAAPPPPVSGLVRRQRDVMAYLQDFIDRHGYAPDQQSMGDALGILRENVSRILDRLDERGWIIKGYLSYRGITIRRRL